MRIDQQKQSVGVIRRSLFVAIFAALAMAPVAHAAEVAGASIPVDAEILWSEFGTPTAMYSRSFAKRTAAGAEVDARSAFQSVGALFGLGAFDKLVLDSVHDADDLDVLRFRQTWKGLDVFGAEVAISLSATDVTAIQGKLSGKIQILDLPEHDEASLRKFARDAVLQHAAFANVSVDDALSHSVFVDALGKAHLVARFIAHYTSAEGAESDEIFVDRHTGMVLAQHALNHRAAQSIHDWSVGGGYGSAERCVDASVWRSGAGWPTRTYTDDGGSVWVLQEAQEHSPGASWYDPTISGAYWGLRLTDRFYTEFFARNSYDGAGARIVSNVRLSTRDDDAEPANCSDNNAYWAGGVNQMVFLPPTDPSIGDLARDLNIVAHELTHGYTQFTSNLVYARESGALNEATSDIIAETVEWLGWRDMRYRFPQKLGHPILDWQVGTNAVTPGRNANTVLGRETGRLDALRYFFNPRLERFNNDHTLVNPGLGSAYRYMDRFFSTCTVPNSSNDRCGAHLNSGIANQWFFLTAVGGGPASSATDTRVGVPPMLGGIGIQPAAKIWFEAMMGPERVTSLATFRDARNATIRAAARLYPANSGTSCSKELLAVKRAWDLVGWASDVSPARDLMPCVDQIDLIENGTFETLVPTAADQARVREAWLAFSVHGGTDAAKFVRDIAARDTATVAVLGGTGRSGDSELWNRLVIPMSVSTSRLPSARLSFSARRIGAADAADMLVAEILTGAGEVIALGTRSASSLTTDFARIGMSVTTATLQRLAGQEVTLRIALRENDGGVTRAQVDQVAFVLAQP